jgi:hypothetical protein
VVPAVFLGIATSIRILGPLAGILVFIYFLSKHPTYRSALGMLLYFTLSIIISIATWPYLWEDPARFLEVFRFMSANPTIQHVLFGGKTYRAHKLPGSYLLFFLFFTLTEFVWPLFILGLPFALRKMRTPSPERFPLALVLAWLVIPMGYVVFCSPPMYDGMRHFLFILPPVFIFSAFLFDYLLGKIKRPWAGFLLIAAIISPGIAGIVRLHPYQYTYYNSFIGGTAGAFRNYQTDYWLTCYKEAIAQFNQMAPRPAVLYVHREPAIAAAYTADGTLVKDERGANKQVRPGDYILVNTRNNEDLRTFPDARTVLTIGREGAYFCVIKQVQ